jgi:hypothetical protein
MISSQLKGHAALWCPMCQPAGGDNPWGHGAGLHGRVHAAEQHRAHAAQVTMQALMLVQLHVA